MITLLLATLFAPAPWLDTAPARYTPAPPAGWHCYWWTDADDGRVVGTCTTLGASEVPRLAAEYLDHEDDDGLATESRHRIAFRGRVWVVRGRRVPLVVDGGRIAVFREWVYTQEIER